MKKRDFLGRKRLLIGVALGITGIFLMCSPAFGSRTFQPVYNPNLQVMKTASKINVDGLLDDPGWTGAGCASNFVERYPGDMTQPEVETAAFVTYDNDNLYVAFVCHDDPETIRATMCQRDQFGGDDAVCLLLDTFGDATRAYEFFVNPYGIQKDRLWSSVGGEDGSFDLIWTSAAQITDSGYQVEMAIPFTSLRFPGRNVQTWKMDFWRNRPRDSYLQYSWAAYDRNEQCWVCQWGTVEGISNVKPGKGLEILPSFVASQYSALPDRQNPDSGLTHEDVMGDMTLGVKYPISSDLILDATLNPDFSQIEADAQQIDVNSPMALLYPERRPFFQEGRDIFRTLFNSFYTRTINDPNYAAKVTSRMDRTTIGFLSAHDETSPYVIPLDDGDITLNGTRSVVNVLRGLRTIGDDNRIGLMITDRRFRNSGSGTIFALDGDIRLSRNYSIDGQFVLSHTREPDNDSHTFFFEGDVPPGYEDSVNVVLDGMTFNNGKHTVAFDGEAYYGNALITRLKRNARYWNFVLDYNQVNPSYRTQTGYDPYMNYRNLSLSTSYTFYPEKSTFERITPRFYTLQRWNYDGLRKLSTVNAGVYGQIKFAQMGFNTSYSRNEQIYAGDMYDNLWSAEFGTDARISGQFGYYVGFNVGRGISYIQRTKGDELSFSTSVYFRPWDRLTVEPQLNFIRSRSIDNEDELFRQVVGRARIQMQFNRKLSLRLVVQYNYFKYLIYGEDGSKNSYRSRKWDIDPLITYRIGSFSVFYIGSTNDVRHINNMTDNIERWRLTDRQFFMKIQYLFQT